MKHLPLLAALVGLSVATPAAAVLTTFATFSSAGGTNVRWINSGTAADRANDAVYYTTSTPNATVPGGVVVNFSFINSLIAPMVNNISAVYTMNAVVAKDSPVLVLGNAYIQPGLSGSFSFVSTSDITISGPGLITTTYAAGSNLLSGTFSGGNVVTNRFGSSGASFASGINGSDISFTSDFLTIDAMAQLDRATSLTAIAPTAFTAANGALRSFRAVTGGQFSAEPNPIPAAEIVPEPASWAMLIAGFSLVGVAMRRRKRALVA